MIRKIVVSFWLILLIVLGGYIIKWNYLYYTVEPKAIETYSGLIDTKYTKISACDYKSSCTYHYFLIGGKEHPVTSETYYSYEAKDKVTLNKPVVNTKYEFYSSVHLITILMLIAGFIFFSMVVVLETYLT